MSTAPTTVWMYGVDEPTTYHDATCECATHCRNCHVDLPTEGVLGSRASYCSEYCKGVAKRERALDRQLRSL